MWERLSRIPYTGWNRKEGRGNKDLKKGGGGSKLDQGVGVLKRWRGLEPFANCLKICLMDN